MNYLLDTTVCVDLLRGVPSVQARLAQASPSDCAVSAVTAYEMSVGVHRCRHPEREETKLRCLFSAVEVLPFDHRAGEEAARIRHHLELAGARIGPYDLLIAGHARSENRVLISSNTAEFSRVPELACENWRA